MFSTWQPGPSFGRPRMTSVCVSERGMLSSEQKVMIRFDGPDIDFEYEDLALLEVLP